MGHYADGQLRGSSGQRRLEEERRLPHGIIYFSTASTFSILDQKIYLIQLIRQQENFKSKTPL